MNAKPADTVHVFVDGAGADVQVDFVARGAFTLGPDGEVIVFSQGSAFTVSRSSGALMDGAAASDGIIRAPMPGRVVQIAMATGDRASAGQTVLVLEAMKMEQALTAPFDGVIAELLVAEGDQVTEGANLARLEAVA